LPQPRLDGRDRRAIIELSRIRFPPSFIRGVVAVASPIETPDMEQPDITTRTGLSVLQVMWQRKSLVVLGILLGMVLGLLYYAQKQPVYQSQAQILIVKKNPADDIQWSGGARDSRMMVMEDYIATQQHIVKSSMILSAALKLPKVKDLRTFTSDSEFDRLYDLNEKLNVSRADREGGSSSNILTLSFRGPIPDDCQTILEGIIDSYQAFLDRTFKSFSEKHFDLITQAKETLVGRYDVAQKEYANFRLTAPYVGRGPGANSMIGERIGKLETLRQEVKIKMQEMADQLVRIETAYKTGGPEKGNADALKIIKALNVKLGGSSEQVSKWDDMLLQLELGKKELLQTLGPNNPRIKDFDDRINEIRRMTGRGGSDATVNNPDDAKSYMAVMRQEIDVLTTKIETLTNMIESDKKEAREMNQFEVTEERLRTTRDQTQKLMDTIASQLEKIDVLKGFGGYDAHKIAPPSQARKVAPTALTVFPLAGIGGLAAGLCLAYLAEISDKSFRNPAEIRRRLGMAVIGHIPYYAPDEKAAKQVASGEPVVDPMLCAHYQSNAVQSEAFRSVRTALYFNTHGVGHQVIQVTSPNVSDGKTTLAANLAISIAQSGKRTIMIDGDCRRPRLHKIFNVPADSGLATVIAGQSDLASAIRPTAIPNLSVLPCGPRPSNPAELLTSPRFKELLDVIRSQYDFVIVDTPPLLVVTDPCVVAPRVDGVILAIRLTKNGRPFAERSKEILSSLGANVLGVVVNGVGSPAGAGKYGYGYDNYNYGYGYTYRYSYTYTDEYSDDKAAAYYETPADAPVQPPAEEPK
jgi:capsular exopolysaccharide synthesis family protein